MSLCFFGGRFWFFLFLLGFSACFLISCFPLSRSHCEIGGKTGLRIEVLTFCKVLFAIDY